MKFLWKYILVLIVCLVPWSELEAKDLITGNEACELIEARAALRWDMRLSCNYLNLKEVYPSEAPGYVYGIRLIRGTKSNADFGAFLGHLILADNRVPTSSKFLTMKSGADGMWYMDELRSCFNRYWPDRVAMGDCAFRVVIPAN